MWWLRVVAIPIPHRDRAFFHDLHPGESGAAEAEWIVYRNLRDQLDEPWRLLSHVVIRKPGRGNHQREADILLLHPQYGMVIGEVKSSNTSNDKATKAMDQVDGVRDFLKKVLVKGKVPGAKKFSRYRFFLACPDVEGAPRAAELSLYFNGHEAIVKDDLANLAFVVEERICQGVDDKADQLGEAHLQSIVEYLTRGLNLKHDEVVFSQVLGREAEREIHEQVRQLIGMNLNKKVFVTGGAGSGKTWLATEWARKAAADKTGEGARQQVLLTCYNEALADVLAESMAGVDGVKVQAFLRHLEDQLGEPHAVASRGEDLKERWKDLTERIGNGEAPRLGRFDVIVVDEIQDFEDEWVVIAMEALLNDGGSILAVGDQRQNVRSINLSHLEKGWARNELRANLRSPAEIARFAQRFGGSSAEGPEWPPHAVDIRPVRSDAEVVDAVSSLIDKMPPARRSQTWVLTTSQATRDLLRSLDREPPFVRWEERDRGVLCVTAEKVKGLEVAHVILVADRLPESGLGLDELLYAGATRAVEKVTVLTTPEVAAALSQEGTIDWSSVMPSSDRS